MPATLAITSSLHVPPCSPVWVCNGHPLLAHHLSFVPCDGAAILTRLNDDLVDRCVVSMNDCCHRTHEHNTLATIDVSSIKSHCAAMHMHVAQRPHWLWHPVTTTMASKYRHNRIAATIAVVATIAGSEATQPSQPP
ncbi:hypothetical protein B296_00046771 [Ensete ventricosum]|uniref:Uncharacterized protein n=1 Tax=Ensete ventricosum TaxID=4639 RepID=A0A426YJU6_ENSVE|nr:hypothetical protein B296_00046771 [Ensete ventricosum]